jgi:adenylylsulfate kinase
METRSRSLVKSVSWRLFGLLFTSLIGWLVTGSIRAGLTIGLMDFALKIGTFYAHERLWLRVRWGRLQQEQIGNGGGI